MRKLSYIILAGGLLMTASCKKYLDTVPNDVLTVDEIFTSKTTVDEYLANIYQALPDEMEQRFVQTDNSGPWEGASDDAKYNWDFVYANQMDLSTWSNTDGTIESFWSSYYQAIRNCTDFMNRINTAKVSEVPVALQTQYKAEARGLRAIFYYNLLRMYGPVVLLGDNLISSDASPASVDLPRTPFDSCVAFVVQQLDSAYLDLPGPLSVSVAQSGNGNLSYGRINRGVVKAYKEQMLMLAASPLYNGNSDFASLKNKDGSVLISQSYDVNKWQLAANAAKAFMDEFVPGNYALYTDNNPDSILAAYRACRDVMLKDWNQEWIFARSQSGSYMRYDRTPKHVGGPTSEEGGGAMGVTQSMVDAYFMNNGRSIGDANSGYQTSGFTNYLSVADEDNTSVFTIPAHSTYNQWINREPRFYVGVTYDSSYWLYQQPGYNPVITAFQLSGNSGRSQSTSDVSPTGYVVRKNLAANDNARGALLLRLANIYMDYIEALNEYDPGNPDILKYLNIIRQRAGIPQYGVPSTLVTDADGTNPGTLAVPASQDDMRTAIRKERRVELAFENVRYFDTRRWKIAPTTDAGPFYGMNMYVDGANFYQKTLLETRIFRQRDYLFPIPNNEVLKDNLMVQNPGW